MGDILLTTAPLRRDGFNHRARPARRRRVSKNRSRIGWRELAEPGGERPFEHLNIERVSPARGAETPIPAFWPVLAFIPAWQPFKVFLV